MRHFSLTAICVFLFLTAAQAQECDFYAKSGAKVSQANGECTIDGKALSRGAVKSGLEKCVHRDDKRLLSEINWSNGKREGLSFYHDYNDRRIVATFRNDLPDGPAQVFSKEKHLLCQMAFKEGAIQGPVRELYPSGKLKGAYEFEGKNEGRGRIELLEDGKIKTLECTSRLLAPEAIAPCGFEGRLSSVQLFNDRGIALNHISYWQNGKLTKRETVDSKGRAMTRTYLQPGEESIHDVTIAHRNGKLFQSYSQRKGGLHGPFKEFSEDGTLLQETLYEQETPISESHYFMNGKPKRKVLRTADGKRLEVQEFWDNGKPRINGSFIESTFRGGTWENLIEDGEVLRYSKDGVLLEQGNFRAGRYDGAQKRFFENGKIAVELRYEKDKVRLTKCYDPSGKLELSEEYFEDGSLKSGSSQMSQKEREASGICRLDR
jgi:uncharacterized protein